VTRRTLLIALAAYGALLALTAPAWPDDWDGIGFLESVRDFDLARFHPHPPGYPVYVALLRVAAVLVREPMRASVLVAVVSGIVAVGLAVEAAGRAAGARASALVGVLVAVTPLAWRTCSGVGSEAPALACVAACAWGLATTRSAPRAGPLTLGLGVGLGLGVRLSWGPLYLAALALAPRGHRRPSCRVAAAATLAWAVPLVAVVGPARLAALYAAHFAGHAERWGGTVVTEPGWARVAWLARDVFVDGLGAGPDVPGVMVGALGVAALSMAVGTWHRAGWPGWRVALVLLGPYLLWIALGQNLRDQPRHVLPLVAAVAAALGLAANRSRWAFRLTAALALAMALRTALDAHARRTIPPPGEQLVELARAQPSPDRLAVFGTASVRFFEPTELASTAFPAGSLGDVQVTLTKMDALPSRVWVTNEVLGRDQSRWPLVPLATLCRPPRLDRRASCLDVYEWRLPYLRQ
jgi:hypothetical protein